MINLILEFKKWLEAFDYSCGNRNKHYLRIKMMLNNKDYKPSTDELNKEIANKSNNPVFQNVDFLDYILKIISRRTREGKEFLDFCKMTPEDVISNIYIIAKDMVDKNEVLDQIYNKTIQQFSGKNVIPNQEDILFKTIARFMINPFKMVKDYEPAFKELFKKEKAGNIESWENIKQSNSQSIQDIDDRELNLNKRFLDEILKIEVSDVYENVKNSIDRSLTDKYLSIDEVFEFYNYIQVTKTPDKFNPLKISFYTKLLQNLFDKIASNQSVTRTDLDNYANDYVKKMQMTHAGLFANQVEMIKAVSEYFNSSSAVNKFSKLIKVLLAVEASEVAKRKDKELESTKPVCGMFAIWIKNKFKVEYNLNMDLFNDKLLSSMFKSILGKDFKELCVVKELEDF